MVTVGLASVIGQSR